MKTEEDTTAGYWTYVETVAPQLGGKGGTIAPLREGTVVSIKKLCHAQFAIYATLDWKNRWLSASDVAQRLSVETDFFSDWSGSVKNSCGPTGETSVNEQEDKA